jgi:hypothetical protein
VGAGLAGASQITVMCWFKAEATPNAGEPSGVVTSRAVVDDLGASRLYGLDITNLFEVDGRISSQAVRSVALTYTLGAWHHAAVVYDGANRILYVDGVAVNTIAQTDITVITSGGEWLIGVDPSNIDGRRFTGCIDDVAIFNCAVPAASIGVLALKDSKGNPIADLGEVLDPTHVSTNDPDGDDGDTMCDTWEGFYFGSTGASDGTTSSDGDSLTDAEELNIYFTNPTLSDTDSDSLNDDLEVNGTNNKYVMGVFTPAATSGDPTDPNDADSDDDTLTDGDELDAGTGSAFLTDPNNAGTDGDMFSDSDEIDLGSNPLDGNVFPDFYPNLVGYWPLDNANGATALQKSEFDAGGDDASTDGMLENSDGVTWKLSTGAGDGICGYADMSGNVGSFFSMSIPGLASNEPQLTIMGWIKPRSIPAYLGVFFQV